MEDYDKKYAQAFEGAIAEYSSGRLDERDMTALLHKAAGHIDNLRLWGSYRAADTCACKIVWEAAKRKGELLLMHKGLRLHPFKKRRIRREMKAIEHVLRDYDCNEWHRATA